MMSKLFSHIATILIALTLGACAAPSGPSDMSIRQGRIEQISPATIPSSEHTGVGAILGGLAGVGVGSLIGGGTGRDVAMVVGAIGGTVAGAKVAQRYDSPLQGQHIYVRTNSGVLVSVTQPVDVSPGLRVGQSVYIQGSGVDARVIPQ